MVIAIINNISKEFSIEGTLIRDYGILKNFIFKYADKGNTIISDDRVGQLFKFNKFKIFSYNAYSFRLFI